MHTLCFGQKFSFAQNSQNQEKLTKQWFQRKLPKTTNDIFFLKRVFFGMGEKVVFTNCVFEKLCPPENTMFMVFSAKTAAAVKKMYVGKRKMYEK